MLVATSARIFCAWTYPNLSVSRVLGCRNKMFLTLIHIISSKQQNVWNHSAGVFGIMTMIVLCCPQVHAAYTSTHTVHIHMDVQSSGDNSDRDFKTCLLRFHTMLFNVCLWHHAWSSKNTLFSCGTLHVAWIRKVLNVNQMIIRLIVQFEYHALTECLLMRIRRTGVIGVWLFCACIHSNSCRQPRLTRRISRRLMRACSGCPSKALCTRGTYQHIYGQNDIVAFIGSKLLLLGIICVVGRASAWVAGSCIRAPTREVVALANDLPRAFLSSSSKWSYQSPTITRTLVGSAFFFPIFVGMEN